MAKHLCALMMKMFAQFCQLLTIKTIKYGLTREGDVYGSDVELLADKLFFRVHTKNGLEFPVTLNMPGRHNVLNALAAITVALDLEIPFAIIQEALAQFKGIERRFSYSGKFYGAELFDDYGHHPKEI